MENIKEFSQIRIKDLCNSMGFKKFTYDDFWEDNFWENSDIKNRLEQLTDIKNDIKLSCTFDLYTLIINIYNELDRLNFGSDYDGKIISEQEIEWNQSKAKKVLQTIQKNYYDLLWDLGKEYPNLFIYESDISLSKIEEYFIDNGIGHEIFKLSNIDDSHISDLSSKSQKFFRARSFMILYFLLFNSLITIGIYVKKLHDAYHVIH